MIKLYDSALSGNCHKVRMMLGFLELPVAELGNYHTTLKSLTGGEGAYTMEFDHYGIVPRDVQVRLAAAARPQDKTDVSSHKDHGGRAAD